jgi:hypothetical protein
VTGAEFSGVDIDLLADYVGGALDGTPEQARVAALIADEPVWRDAYALLAGGMTAVGEALRDLGREPEPMPADVFARLDSVLSAATAGEFPEADQLHAPAAAAADTSGDGAGSGAPAAGAAPGRHLVAVPASGVDAERSPRARRRRRAWRWAGPLAAAAAVLAFAGVGISYLGGDSPSDNARSSGGFVAAAPVTAALPADGGITSSNTDYRRSTLGAAAGAPFAAESRGSALKASGIPRTEATPSAGVMSDHGLADGLAPLRPREALQACLNAIAVENGAGPITVQTVDYARFDGAPALVVRFTAGNGRWVWASGPGCGSPGVGAGTRYSVKVG